MALQWGADDLDGTIGEELIAHAALASSPAGMTTSKLVKLIREAGRLPVQRDALYNVVGVYPAPGYETHWSQRQGIAGADPVANRGALADARALDVEHYGLHTWELVGAAGREIRELATTPFGEVPNEVPWLPDTAPEPVAEELA